MERKWRPFKLAKDAATLEWKRGVVVAVVRIDIAALVDAAFVVVVVVTDMMIRGDVDRRMENIMRLFLVFSFLTKDESHKMECVSACVGVYENQREIRRWNVLKVQLEGGSVFAVEERNEPIV